METYYSHNDLNYDDMHGYDAGEDEDTWIEQHCSKKGNELLLKVPEEFFVDFNLYGLSH